MNDLDPAAVLAFLLPPGHLRINGPGADLCLRIGLDGFRPPSLEFSPVVGGTWAGKRLARPESSKIILVDGVLRVELEEACPPALALHNCDDRSSPALLQLESGVRIEARLGLVTSRRLPSGGRTLELHDWTARREGAATLWVGIIPTDFITHTRTNLVLAETTLDRVNTSRFNLRLDGNYSWSLLAAKDEVVAVVEPGPAGLERNLLVADFCAIQFAFGRPLALPNGFIGLNKDGESVAWVSVPALVRELHTRKVSGASPVPHSLSVEAMCWAAEFFEAVAKEFALPGERSSWVAFGSYLSSLHEDLDSAYLKLHVALEALCHEITQPRRRPLVNDSAAWKKWVDTHSSEIAAFATDTDSEAATKLLNKVKAAENPPATDVVEDTLKALDLAPPAAFVMELKGRNRSTHKFSMSSSQPERDLLADWQRVRRLRALLVAVFSKLIRYEGAICDCAVDALGNPLSAQWWPKGGGNIAQRSFVYWRKRA